MTHDQREAQHAVERIILRRIYERRIEGYTIETAKEIVGALTASPGEQEPCGWQFCCPDGKWIGCDEPPANELRDEPEKFRRVYLSPPPAAGWDVTDDMVERSCKAYADATGYYVEFHRGLSSPSADGMRKGMRAALKALRREAPAPEGVVEEPTLAVRLEARPTNGSADWTEIFPAQLNWVAKAGHEVRAIEVVDRPDAGGGVRVKPLEWSGRSSNGKIHKAYVVPMEYWAWESAGYGYWSWGSLAGREVHGGLDGAKAAAQADYERRILSALSTSPVAAESNASVEARLREALIALDERLRSCGNLHTAEDAYDSFYQEIVSEALSAAGDGHDNDEKSEGGVPAGYERVTDGTTLPGDKFRYRLDDNKVTGEVIGHFRPINSSDSTAERREIVARIEARAQAYDSSAGALYHGAVVAKELRAILAALDGGAGA